MKKLILLSAAVLGFSANAQEVEMAPAEARHEHEVKIGAIKMLSGPILEGTYEFIQTEDFAFGASVLYSFVENSDFQEDFSVTPFARFYFQEVKQYDANGFFVEGFAKYMKGHRFKDEFDWIVGQTREERLEFSAGAVGLSLGKKWTNKTGIIFEILIGGGRTLGGSDRAPDAVFRGDFNLGYRF